MGPWVLEWDGTHIQSLVSGYNKNIQGLGERSLFTKKIIFHCACVLSCLSHIWLCVTPMDCSPPGSSVHGILQKRILEWVSMPSFRDLPSPGIEPASLMSPALAGRFFTTYATRKAHISLFSSVQSLSHVWLFPTLWTVAHQASLSITNSQSLLSSCPSSQWCHPTISSSVVPFSSCLQSFPASGSFPMSQFFALGGQSTGASASASALPMNIQDWFPLGWTGLIMQSKGLSRGFSNTTVQKHQFCEGHGQDVCAGAGLSPHQAGPLLPPCSSAWPAGPSAPITWNHGQKRRGGLQPRRRSRMSRSTSSGSWQKPKRIPYWSEPALLRSSVDE